MKRANAYLSLLLSHKHQCIFVHIPKCAGQSIATYFLDDLDLEWNEKSTLLMRKNPSPEKGPRLLAHLKLNEYLAYNYISEEKFQTYFKFAFVRNPWSRVLSFYKYGWFHEFISFELFVNDYLPKLINDQNWFFGSMYDFIYEDGQTAIDFIGRYENLHEDFETICQKMNWTKLGLTQKNSSKARTGFSQIKFLWRRFKKDPQLFMRRQKDKIRSTNYRDYYTTELIEQVGDYYKKDVEGFGYTFEK